MASFKSVLSAIGHVIAKVFSPKAIQIEASIADIALPQFSSLINLTAGAIINVENASIAAGVQSGTGAQKFELVASIIGQQYISFCQENNLPIISDSKKKFVDAIVAALNSFPAPTTATSTTTNSAASATL